MQIEIKLFAHYSHSGPLCIIDVNDKILHKGILPEGENNFVFQIDANDINYLHIQHHGKTNEDTIVDNDGKIIADKAIELKKITIENVHILENVLYNKPYYVYWPENIIEDYKNKGETAPEYITNTLFFGFNGYYEFDFVGDFLKQYYRQFWENEDQAHNNQTKLINVNGEQVESFERFGEETAVNQEFDLTIHDLAKIINDE